MAFIRKRRPWTSQPQEAARVDARWQINPIALFNAASPGAFFARADTSIVPSDVGLSALNATPGSTVGLTTTTGITSAQTAFTYIGIFDYLSGGSSYNGLCNSSTSNSGIGVANNGVFALSIVKRGVGAIGSINLSSGPTVYVVSTRTDTGEYYMLSCPLGGGGVSRSSGTDTRTFSNSNGTHLIGAAYDGGYSGRYPLGVMSFDFLSQTLGEQLVRDPWQLFAPQSIWVPVSAGGGGGTVTASTNIGAAIQAARSAAASVNAAIQSSASTSASVNAAIVQAKTIQAALGAAILQARNSTASVNAAIAAAKSKTATVDAAISLQKSATASISANISAASSASASADAAILESKSASASVQAYIQAGSSASASLDAAVQQSRTGNATIDGVIQRALSAAAGLNSAVQAQRTAAASLSAQIQAGTSQSASLDAAVLEQKSASAALSSAISVARSASSSLSAMIAVHSSVSAAVSAVVQSGMSMSAGLGAYILSDEVDDLYPLAGQSQDFPLAGQSQTYPLTR